MYLGLLLDPLSMLPFARAIIQEEKKKRGGEQGLEMEFETCKTALLCCLGS